MRKNENKGNVDELVGKMGVNELWKENIRKAAIWVVKGRMQHRLLAVQTSVLLITQLKQSKDKLSDQFLDRMSHSSFLSITLI